MLKWPFKIGHELLHSHPYRFVIHSHPLAGFYSRQAQGYVCTSPNQDLLWGAPSLLSHW